MNIWLNIKYYLNYLNFNRGDNQIRNFFASNEYYNSIKELMEEGYTQFRRKFEEIVDSYTLLYPLNRQEISFINNIIRDTYTCPQSFKDYSYFEINIRATTNYIVAFKNTKDRLPKKYRYDLIKLKSRMFKKKIEQIWPITDAVISRRFSKKLLEILIKNNINKINVVNYIPDIKILKNYRTSVASNYIYRKGKTKNIKQELDKLISDMEKEAKLIENIENNYPNIVFSNEKETEIKIIQTLLKMKKACNQIIHFIRDKNQNLYIVNSLFEDFKIHEEEAEEEEKEQEQEQEREEEEEEEDEINLQNQNSINISNEINEMANNKERKISISKAANFIAFGNSSFSMEQKLESLSSEINETVKIIQAQMNDLSKKKTIDGYREYKRLLIKMLNDINAQLSRLVLKNYDIKLSENEISTLSDYFKKNMFYIGSIKRDEINMNLVAQTKVDYIDMKRNSMSTKEKLLLNATFGINIELLNIKKEIDALIPVLNSIKDIKKSIRKLDKHYKKELAKLNVNYNNIVITSKYINRSDIFSNMSKNEFIDNLESLFKNANIDFNNEINNFYFYIYLLKKKLFDDKSYKLAADINDDYM